MRPFGYQSWDRKKKGDDGEGLKEYYFAFLLARDLRIIDPYQMLREMPARLYMDWRALYEESPDLGRRIDFSAANVSNTIYNMLKGRKGRKGRIKDFLLNFVPQRIKDAAPDLLQKVEVLNRLFGGKDMRKKN